MAYIVQGYRDILYYQQMPDLKGLLLVFGLSLILLFIGYQVFNHLQKHFAEEL